MKRTALALSPHLDDAAFSCGGTLAMLAQAGWHVVVATLFTRSVPDPTGFALACQVDKGLGPEIDYMALRRAEDAAAMSALGAAPPVHVPLPEAPHRGYGSAAALFGPPRADDTVTEPLRAAVAALLAKHQPDLVMAPQATGGHVDHIQVVRALEGTRGIVASWRDFPYSARDDRPAEPFRDRMQGLPEWSVKLDDAAIEARRSSCLAYASQLGFQFGGIAGLFEGLSQAGSIERFRAAGPMPV